MNNYNTAQSFNNFNYFSLPSFLYGYQTGFQAGYAKAEEEKLDNQDINVLDNYIFYKNLDIALKHIERESIQENLFSAIMKKAEAGYFMIHNQFFDKKNYEQFFIKIKTFVTSNSDLLLFSDSARLDINYEDKKICIEYSPEDDFLTVSSELNSRVVIKETSLDKIQETMGSFLYAD